MAASALGVPRAGSAGPARADLVSTTQPASGPSAQSAASQPGLTASTVTVANVSILSGPVPGLFAGAPYGAAAYFAYLNANGGVHGRKVELKSLDDGFSCTLNQSLTQSAITQVFAFVGNFSLFDNCGGRVLRASPQVPDVSVTLDPAARSLSNNFSPVPSPPGYGLGPLLYYKQHYPKAVNAVGAIVGNVSSATTNWTYQRAAMQSVGYQVRYVSFASPLQTDYTADILRMRHAGVKLLWLTDEDVGGVSRILNAAQQQGWHPALVSSPTAYDATFFHLVNAGAAQGVSIPNPAAMYLGEDRGSTPAVARFLKWLHRTHPGFAPDLFAVFGWTSAQLFAQALQSAGPHPTQQAVMAALESTHHFNADGLLPSADVGAKQPGRCWLLAEVHDGRYVRVDPPHRGFTCSPSGYFHYRGS